MFNDSPLAVWMLLLLLELLVPLREPRVGMLCLVEGAVCCCIWESSVVVLVCGFVPLPVSITIFEVPEVVESPVDWRRGLVSCERNEDEAVEVVCFRGRRKVAERVTCGLLIDN